MTPDINDLDSIWSLVVEFLSQKHPSTAIALWFKDMKLTSLTPTEAIFTTTTDVKKNVILQNFSDEIAEDVLQVIGYKPKIVVISKENGETDLSKQTSNSIDNVDLNEKDYKSEYTFDNFVVGSSNKLAHAAALAVAEKNFDDIDSLSKDIYNPLFIYGPSGVGKTHLLYAITNKISSKYPDKKIIYVKGEEFTNQLIDAIQKKTTTQFRDKYRNVDVLLIDDIQFVAGRTSTQEELFNTFNAIHEVHKQIILTSDRPPNEMKTLDERLRTRFLSGLITDVSLPDFELRLAILQQKVKQNNLYLDQNNLVYIAENVTSSIRQLEGVIKKLGAIHLLEGAELSFERVKEAIKDFVQVKENENQKMDDIIMLVSKKYNVSRDDILSEKRNKEITLARHVCVYLARQTTSLSQTQIAKALNRERTTIINSESFVKKEIDNNPDFSLEIRELKNNLTT